MNSVALSVCLSLSLASLHTTKSGSEALKIALQ